MTKLFFCFISGLISNATLAQCNTGNYTVTGNLVISSSCIISGDLTIVNGATLDVDLTNAAADTFVVRGNILLRGNAVLWVHSATGSTNDQFIISNNYSNQRTITALDSSRVQLENIEFRTQEGDLTNAASLYMNYDAADNSVFYINNSWLETRTAWLLCNLKNRATLIGYRPNHVPTESYFQDTAQVTVHGAGTNIGIWLNFESVTGTLDLPPNQAQPYTWKVGRSAGGLFTSWYLEVDSANPGLGVQIFPTSKININGAGLPATGELKVALLFANSTDTMKALKVGLQNTTIANGLAGSVTLNNVNLGPIAWQLYALANENLFVKNSVVNEIGIAGPSRVTVESSVLQFGALAAVGTGGSSMMINNSEIWNQAITAANNSIVTLDNCKITGSAFSTTDNASHITVNGGCFFQNSSGCSEDAMVDIATGYPLCNPFIPAGYPQNLSPASVTFNGANYGCTDLTNDSSVRIFPNPSENLVQIKVPNAGEPYSIEVYSIVGQRLFGLYNRKSIDISNLASGIYIITVKQQGKKWVNKIAKI